MGDKITCGNNDHGLYTQVMAKPEKTHPLYLWRKKHRVTLQALADQVEVSQPHLSEIENWNNVPSLELTATLSKATGLDMQAFVKPAMNAESAAC